MVVRGDNWGFGVYFYVSLLLKLNKMKRIFNAKTILVILVFFGGVF